MWLSRYCRVSDLQEPASIHAEKKHVTKYNHNETTHGSKYYDEKERLINCPCHSSSFIIRELVIVEKLLCMATRNCQITGVSCSGIDLTYQVTVPYDCQIIIFGVW